MLLFAFFSVCFETDLFVSVVSVVSKRVKNTETNRNEIFLVSRNKPKINRNRFSFGLFRFEPKFFFVCFENTLFFINKTRFKLLKLFLILTNNL
jgi:hypothetical protein